MVSGTGESLPSVSTFNSGSLGKASFLNGTVDSQVGIFLYPLNTCAWSVMTDSIYLGRVVQSIASRTIRLRRQFVKHMPTTNFKYAVIFCWKNVRIFSIAKDSHIFPTKITAYL